MKYFRIFTILLISSMISFYSCSGGDSDVRQKARESVEVAGSSAVPNVGDPNAVIPNPTTTAEPAQNAAGVWHYTCSAGCAGGAGGAGACATCGGPLAHNTAYHGNDSGTPTTPAITPSVAAPTAAPAAEPAQNAAGVWHYTCGAGCAGGAGAAGPCGGCGGTLAHNTAYHQ